MKNQAINRSQSKREFTVADEHFYNHAGPIRWIISHLVRYPHLLVSFLLAAALTNVLFSSIPRLTGLAFDEVLKPEPNSGRLLSIALSILGLVVVRGLLDITNSWSVETLGQRLERDRAGGVVYQPVGEKPDISQPPASRRHHGSSH